MIKIKQIVLLSILNLLFACSDNGNANIDHANKNKQLNNLPTQKTITQPKEINVIDIQPYGDLPNEIINYIYLEVSKVCPKVNLLKVKVLPERAYYEPRKRYRADTIISLLRDVAPKNHVTMGLTNKDISTDKGKFADWGVMGLGFLGGNACVASTFRVSKTKIKEQYFKVAIHELGHTQGLNHCPIITCIMTDANGKNNTDKENGFCEKCKAHLINRGWKLNLSFEMYIKLKRIN